MQSNQEAGKWETMKLTKRAMPPIVPGFLNSNSPLILYCIPVFHCSSAKSEIRAECGEIQYDHDESKEIQAHCQPDGDMHCQNANQPEKPSLFHPDKKWIADFD
jgi:hypothetical protein